MTSWLLQQCALMFKYRSAQDIVSPHVGKCKCQLKIFIGSPEPALASAKAAAGKSTLGRALQWDALAFLPHSTDTDYKLLHIHTHKDMHSPPHPRSLASVALNRQPDKRVCDQRREWLQDRMAACRSWITSPVAKSCVYGVCAFVAEVFFLFSHCPPQGA